MVTPVGMLQAADDVLRGERAAARTRQNSRLAPSAVLALVSLGFGMFYGAVMGTYGGLAGDRPWQLLHSAVKVPFLIVVTFALSLPSFYVINTLLGLRADFPRVLRALMTTQAGLTVILTSLAPFTVFWYASGSAYQAAILFNGMMFAVASFGAQWMLRREYQPLIRSDPKHRWMLATWIFIYVFVGIQMAWVLRPFVGDPGRPVEFFREDSWSNAYEAVAQMIWQVVTGRGR
jgi:hypothetical protein